MIMLEREVLGYIPKVEIIFAPEQDVPFGVKKAGQMWQLSVNRTYFESKGFSPDEINGAIHLEEECLIRQTGVSSQADVEGLRRWQNLASDDPKAVAFKAAFERLAAYSSLEEKRGEKARLAKKYLEKFSSRSLGEDYTDQLFSSVLKIGLGQDKTPDTKLVSTVLNNLKKGEQVKDRNVSALGALTSANLSPAARTSWFESRFLPRLQFLEYQDKLRNEQSKPEKKKESQAPPSPLASVSTPEVKGTGRSVEEIFNQIKNNPLASPDDINSYLSDFEALHRSGGTGEPEVLNYFRDARNDPKLELKILNLGETLLERMIDIDKKRLSGEATPDQIRTLSSYLTAADLLGLMEIKEVADYIKRISIPKPVIPSTPPSDLQTYQAETQSPLPSAASDEFEQHDQPLSIIEPSYSGYLEEDSYDILDETTGRLTKSSTQNQTTEISTPPDNVIENSRRIMTGYSGTNLSALPLPPGFQLTKQGLDTLKSQGIQVFSDSEGHVFIQPAANIQIEPEIAMSINPNNAGAFSVDRDISKQKLPDEIEVELDRISKLSTDSLNKIQQWVNFIKDSFIFPNNDKEVEILRTAVNNSPARSETRTPGGLLDSHLARELFIVGLKRLNLQDIEWRAVDGHYIASAAQDGTSRIHSGTAHTWVKIRLGRLGNWIIVDPTPPESPVHQGEGAINEFGYLSLQRISEEDLQEMERKAIAYGQRRSPETEDWYLLEFAREAGISKEEAQKILAVLSNVDKLKDRQGRLILARLKEQFDRIIEEYTVIRQENLGLVEMSRGHGLEEPVEAFIDIQSGHLDPTGFAKKRLVEEKEQYYGGWDLEVVADGSGSMTESLGGRIKYLVQRDMSYLLQKGLHRFSQEVQRRKLRLVTPLKIRSSQYIFRGNRIEEIKSISDEFTPLQMVLLWKKSAENIGGGTPAHLGLQAILDRIPQKEVQLLKDKKLLKVVSLISDGGYDDPTRVRNLINQLNAINVIVAEFHITDAQSLEDLPQNVAEKVIEAAKLLMPERVRK